MPWPPNMLVAPEPTIIRVAVTVPPVVTVPPLLVAPMTTTSWPMVRSVALPWSIFKMAVDPETRMILVLPLEVFTVMPVLSEAMMLPETLLPPR